MKIPPIGLGTWELRGDLCVDVVQKALDIGYRHIDTAFVYENHLDIARAIKGFDRSQLFLTTKFSIGQSTKDITLSQVDDARIEESLKDICTRACEELGTDYIDLLLLHWPIHDRPLVEIAFAMHKMKEKGLIRSVGVSNYTIHHLQDAYNAGLSIDYNQVEFHPYLYQKELLDFARSHQTELIAYRPFGKGNLLKEEPLLKKIGENYSKSSAQVILRWLYQKKIPTIPKAAKLVHLKENFDILNFSLSEDEEKMINQLDQGRRYCDTDWGEFDY